MPFIPDQAASTGGSPPSHASLKLWLRPESQAGVVDGTAMAAWLDESPTPATPVQATGIKQPVWRTNVKNGLGAAQFDGVNDSLVRAATIPFTAEWTVVLVAAVNAATNISYAFANSAAGGFWVAGTNGLATGIGEYQDGTHYLVADQKPAAWGITTWQRQHIYRDGVETGYSAVVGTLNRLDIDCVGGPAGIDNLGLNGWIGELLAWDRNLSALELAQIWAPLRAKWGTA